MRNAILICSLAGCLLPCFAADPQIVISQPDGNQHVVKIKDTDRLSFGPTGVHLYDASGEGPDIFNYPDIDKIQFDHEGSVTAVREIATDETALRAFPSPARDFITVSGTGDEPISLRIYSTSAECMLTIPAYTGARINVGDFPSGLYLVKAGNKSTKFFKN